MKKIFLIGFICISNIILAQTVTTPIYNTINVDSLIAKMTLIEKIDFIGGYKDFNIRGYAHLGIPEIRMADGPVGMRNYGKSTAYPAGICLAASWDKQMAYNVGKAIGTEARAHNVHIMLGPGVNIYRMPLCGRNFEYFGEDPYLSGEMASKYIIGMQNEGVMACIKHYAANNQEYNRYNVSSNMDERTLHEIYLPAFKKAVLQANVAVFMTSYNLINDVHASQNSYLNNTILKGEWNFKGFIMSDWVSTYDGIACAKGGLDLEMPAGTFMSKKTLIPAITNGKIQESIIDDKIRRILQDYNRFGYFTNPDISKNYVLDSNFTRATSLETARGGMVLLKNENNILPLQKNKIKTIAIIGPNGQPTVSGGGGSSYVDPLHPLSLVDAVKKIAGDSITVIYEKGIFTGVEFPENLFENFEFYYYKNGKKITGVEAKYYNGKNLEGDVIATKQYEKLHIENQDFWGTGELPEMNFSARYTCFYKPKTSGYYSIGGNGDDGYRIILDGVKIVDMWRDQGPSKSKYDMFLNAGQEYKVEVEYYQSGGGAIIELGAVPVKLDKEPTQYLDLAIQAAKKADLVIMSVGFDSKTEGESFDRTYEMPNFQGSFINQIAKVNNNVVVVLNSGGNVEMSSWIQNSKALLMAWYPGQEGNLAAAEILFGKTNPSGKLPASFENTLDENPCYLTYFDSNKDNRVSYNEGIFIGYRYWDKATTKPRFPFGYGLSYTTFAYDGITTNKSNYSKSEPVEVTVTIKNTGNYDGAEVVQLYVSDKVCSLPRPIKELKDFDKIQLLKGESKTVKFTLNQDAFSFYNPKTHVWEVEPGDFEILIGSSSADIKQRLTITIN